MPRNLMEIRLKETSQLTDALWAAWLESDSDGWEIRAGYKINRQQSKALLEFLGRPPNKLWLNGALAGRHNRTRPIPAKINLAGRQIFVFPDQVTQRVILVGADDLSAAARRFWRIVALGNSRSPSFDFASPGAFPSEEPGLGIPFYLPEALDQILGLVTKSVNCQGGWLAVRSGDAFEVKAATGCKDFVGRRIPIEANPLLRDISQKQLARWVSKDQLEWAMVPRSNFKSSTKGWGAIPLIIGRRLIGLIAFWADAPFEPGEWDRLILLARRIAPSVEGSITFADITSHLQRMALLNDFAMTVSSAINLEQIAKRIFALLERAFVTGRISLVILSPDEQTVYHYQLRENVTLQTQSAESLAIHRAVEKGEVYRTEHNPPNSEYTPIYADSLSALLVPLRYRRQLIGALDLESAKEGAFSVYDEHLLVVIASHLAGLIETGRLRQEAELRARNLSLVHEVVEHIIGINDVGQVAQVGVELLARNFAFELAAILLFDRPEGELKAVGIAGSAADIVQRGLGYLDTSAQGGITTRVALTGESMLVSDVNQDPVYRPIPDWDAGSEMCVPLRDGDEILGVIDVESQQKNAFTQNDLLLLEALAGILSSVFSNVSQYQRLQATVVQLQATREELQQRIAAQRVAESRLVQAAKLVAVGEMAAGVAHELNNPLTTVSGFVELVMNELPEKSTARDDLELVLREANRARGVVRRLLDFARQSESAHVRTDFNEIVSDVLALVNHLLQTSGIEVTVELGEHLPWITVDRNQIKQVILNLIHNALHSMPAGGKLWIVTAKRRREKKDYLTVRVRDTGTGIPPENMERVFEPFFTTRSKEGGTGLGLSVSYGIIADHGGFIEVESKVGSGSTFTVWLPVEME
jgi:signal transduction histidine kinase